MGPGADRVLWDDPPQAAAPRSRRLVALAVLPWAVVVVLGALAATALHPTSPSSGPQARPGAETAPHPARREPSRPPSRDPTEAGPAGSASTAASRWSTERLLGAAAALAVRTADLGGRGERRYVDLALPEEVAWYGRTAVVTVGAVVLEGTPDAWHTVRPARYAVPVGVVDGRAVVLGGPWALAIAEPLSDEGDEGDEGGWAPADVSPDDVARAAQAAGYADVDVEAVDEREDLAGMARAQIHARGPEEESARAHELWLATDPSVVVLGTQGASP